MRIVRVLFPQKAVRILPANVNLQTLYIPRPRGPRIVAPGDYVITSFGPYPAVLLAIPDFEDEAAELQAHEEEWKIKAIEIWDQSRRPI